MGERVWQVQAEKRAENPEEERLSSGGQQGRQDPRPRLEAALLPIAEAGSPGLALLLAALVPFLCVWCVP